VFGFAQVTVIGPSMAPAVVHGERWLVTPGRIRPGRLVLLREPDRPELQTVKRIIRVLPDGVWVEGDNAAVSRDSRHYGVVPRDHICGVLRRRLRGAAPSTR
jgi:nickel-type superoxide dismutase maturation protease